MKTWPRGAAALALYLFSAATSQAALFEDDEARRAILDLRQRLETQRQSGDALRLSLETLRQEAQKELQALKQDAQATRQENQALRQSADVLGSEAQKGLVRVSEDSALLRRSLLELQNQIQGLRAELATVRGANEQLARDLAESQRRQKDIVQATEARFQATDARFQATDERFRQFDPVKVTVDGAEFFAEPAEKRNFEAALEVLKKGDFAAAQGVFADFLNRYPQSGYYASGLFWLGNSQYATRDYKEAMVNFRALMSRAPDHLRAPEAALSVANCQIELKDVRGARKTLDELLKAYPQSEAAPVARDRLSRLK